MPITYLVLFTTIIFLVAIPLYRRHALRRKQLEILQQPTEPAVAPKPTVPSSHSLADLGFDTIEDVLPKPNTSSTIQRKQPAGSDILILYVMAPKERPFLGYELMQSLLNVDLRHGNMKIFHRHEHPNGQGRVLFSLAQATEPGIFDLNEMGGLRCTGLSLFMHIAPDDSALNTFNLMLETAQQLADDLAGQLQDINHAPLTPQTTQSYHQQCTGVRFV